MQHEIIGACFALASRRQGGERGPKRLRELGLMNRLREVEPDVVDGGDVHGPTPHPTFGDKSKKRLAELLEFAVPLGVRLGQVYKSGRAPVVIGGDHSVSMISVSAAAAHLRATRGVGARLGLLWVDAHADLHTPETTPSGNLHGMPVAHLLGRGEKELVELEGFSPKIRPQDIVYIGLRDLEPEERQAIRELGILAFSIKEIDLLGIGEVCRRSLTHLQRLDGFVVSYDLDVSDPSVAPGVGTPVRGGLGYRESHLIMEMAAECQGLMAIELMEYNPDLDEKGATAEFAIGLLESAIGKSIL